MLRVVRESTDTCSHRKGGFICKRMYLFVHKQQAHRDTALQGEALLLPHQDQPPAQQLQGAEPPHSPGAGDLPRGQATAEDNAPESTKPNCAIAS